MKTRNWSTENSINNTIITILSRQRNLMLLLSDGLCVCGKWMNRSIQRRRRLDHYWKVGTKEIFQRKRCVIRLIANRWCVTHPSWHSGWWSMNNWLRLFCLRQQVLLFFYLIIDLQPSSQAYQSGKRERLHRSMTFFHEKEKKKNDDEVDKTHGKRRRRKAEEIPI